MRLAFVLFVIVTTACASAQQQSSAAREFPDTAQPEVPGPPATAPTLNSSTNLPDAPSYIAHRTSKNPSMEGSQRVFSLVPNSRAARPEAISPPPTSGQSLNLSGPDGADYSSLIFVGGASTGKAPSDARRPLNAGVSTSENTCPHAAADKADGSNWITSLLSITSHTRGSYCALGEGGFWKRSTYAATRAMVAHRYSGISSFDNSQFQGPGAVPGFPSNYSAYQYQYDAGQKLASRYGYAVGRDALRNIFSEFWPDISTRVLRRHP